MGHYSSARVINVISSRVKILNIESRNTYQVLKYSINYYKSMNFYEGSDVLAELTFITLVEEYWDVCDMYGDKDVTVSWGDQTRSHYDTSLGF